VLTCLDHGLTGRGRYLLPERKFDNFIYFKLTTGAHQQFAHLFNAISMTSHVNMTDLRVGGTCTAGWQVEE